MKKGFILIILLLAVTQAKTQTFTADEMIQQIVRCKTFDCINDFLVTKNFRLYKSTDMSWAFVYSFSGDIHFRDKYPDAQAVAEDIAVIFYTDKRTRNIKYSTSSITCYQKLKENFVQKGFVYQEEHISEDPTKGENKTYQGVESTYKSPRYPSIILSISTVSNNFDGRNWTDYDFKVEKVGID